MPTPPAKPPHRLLARAGVWLLFLLLALAALSATAIDPPGHNHLGVQRLDQAQVVVSNAPRFPESTNPQTLALPDNRATHPPGEGDSSVWYRLALPRPANSGPDELLAAYIERACSGLEVFLNGQRLFSTDPPGQAPGRHCYYPQLVPLPAALLQDNNLLDLRVQGHALNQVAARQRAAGLSVVLVGPHLLLADRQQWDTFTGVRSLQLISSLLLVLGGFLLVLALQNPRREAYLVYFGLLAVVWALLSAQVWWQHPPLSDATVELVAAALLPVATGLGIQFLLSFAGLRWRWVERLLLAQALLLPMLLAWPGPEHLFPWARAAYLLLLLQVLVASGVHLLQRWRSQRQDGLAMLLMLACLNSLLVLEVATQFGLDWLPERLHVMHFALPLLFVAIGSRLMQRFSQALAQAEASRQSLQRRVQQITAEIEHNFTQLAELRVERVTQVERKRIAADLHDDLGAKLLTIVHTSSDERIATLAREALEEMRLSVRGLTGKPVRMADAIADWRIEAVSRLEQAGIGLNWRSPAEEVDPDKMLSARMYVQTTRILREAVSNIIKHSGASQCEIGCIIGARGFGVLIKDNGRGVPAELDGTLDRGHGLASMKNRAKQLQGQCLLESGPGFGLVIKLTLPF